ncbi:hypothetical protein PROFUN_05278 [Planoprotostelium fungivorum]|uniref:PROP1-like PPR domain-containing protein n=1 Tax=Planoprotostelium fungivorum TaxID=1890364 RepID=A0A2P6NRB0_9EUKA|nr:hypothetical protein PROFUN_05278 [Planoprotostelium fungivorum]
MLRAVGLYTKVSKHATFPKLVSQKPPTMQQIHLDSQWVSQWGQGCTQTNVRHMATSKTTEARKKYFTKSKAPSKMTEKKSSQDIIGETAFQEITQSMKRADFETLRDYREAQDLNVDRFFGIEKDTPSDEQSLDDGVRSLVTTRPIVNEETVLELLQGLAYYRKTEDAKKAFDLARRYGVPASVKLWNGLLKSYVKTDLADEAMNLFKKMKEEGIVPNVATYHIMINIFSKAGQMVRAVETLKTMALSGIKPDTACVNTIVHGYMRLGDYNQAWTALDAAEETGLIEFNKQSYSIAITLCAKQKRVEKALLYLDKMERLQIEPDEVIYNSLIAACAMRKDTYEDAVRIYEKSKANGFLPSYITMTCILNAAAVNGDIKAAEAIFVEILDNGHKIDRAVYTTLMKAIYHSQSWTEDVNGEQKVMRIYNQAVDDGFKPDQPMMGAVLHFYSKTKQAAKAEEWWKKMEKTGFVHNGEEYMSMLQMYSEMEDPTNVMRLIQEMEDRGMRLKRDEYFSIIIALSKVFLIETAMRYMRQMKEDGYTLERDTSTRALMKQLELLKDVDAMIELCLLCGFHFPFTPDLDMEPRQIERIKHLVQQGMLVQRTTRNIID